MKFARPLNRKPKRNRGYKGSFLAICNFVFSSSISNLVLRFFHQQALGRAQTCLTVQQILGNSTQGNAINLSRNIPTFFVVKHFVMEENLAKIGIWACAHFPIADHECSFYLTCFISDLRNWLDVEHKHYWTLSGSVFHSCSMQGNKVHTSKQMISRNPCKHRRNATLWRIHSYSAFHSGSRWRK